MAREQKEDKPLSISERMSGHDRRLCTETLNKLKGHPCAFAFLQPVDPVLLGIPDYFDVIKHPMDLSTVKAKLNSYNSKEEFISDLKLMFENCYTYNNQTDPVCEQARVLEKVLNKQINKLRAPPQVKRPAAKVLSSLPENEYKNCLSVIKEFKKVKYGEFNWIFAKPVDASAWGALDYYDIVKQPMDMTTIEKKFNNSEYTSEDQFYNDYKLMFGNCYIYNPPHNDVHLLGKKFEEAFEKHWNKLHDKQKENKQKKQKVDRDVIIAPPTTQDELLSRNTITIQRSINGTHRTIPNSVDQTPTNPIYQSSAAPVQQFSMDPVQQFSMDPVQQFTMDPVQQFSIDPIHESSIDPVYQFSAAPIYQSSVAPVRESGVTSTQTLAPNLVRVSVSAPVPASSSTRRQTPEAASVPVTKSLPAPASTPVQANEGRNVLRIKLNVKKPKNEASESSSSKPTVKVSGLALSKDPPTTTPTPKLALDHLPSSPQLDKKDHKPPIVLQNQDKWLAEAKQHALQKQQSSAYQTVKNKSTSSNNQAINKLASSPINRNNAVPSTVNRQSSVSKSPEPPKTPMFDIGDLYNKINDEKRLRQQQLREEQERDRIRREKERQRYEEHMVKKREFRQKMSVKKEMDKAKRIEALDERVVDISAQKMSSHIFESTILSKDLDWRELNNWQRETVDYRHIPVPAFVRRSNINLQELRSKLLNKSVRLKNLKNQTGNSNQTVSHDSDMDIE
ncbi:unnamed protein product [Rhizopus stolonifer]